MIELLSNPAVWVSFFTLTVLEIVLGVDNVIFISIAAARLPPAKRKQARLIGLAGALVLRVMLLFSISWIARMEAAVITVLGLGLSWRDLILIAGGAFLIWKATTEIFAEVEGEKHAAPGGGKATLAGVVTQIMILDLIFSLDSVITAPMNSTLPRHSQGRQSLIPVVLFVAAEPIANFVAAHPSTKMLALAFLVMVGMALVADGLHHHIERAFIYAAMIFGGAVEGLNLWRQKRRRARSAH